NTDVKENEASDPFLVAGFDRKVLHLAHKSPSPVTFTIEVDQEGNGNWSEYTQITVPASGYAHHIFPADFSGTWVRLRSGENIDDAVGYFVLSQKDLRKANKNPKLFASVAEIDSDKAYTYGLVRPGTSDDVSLQFVAYEQTNGEKKPLGYYEVG